MRILLAGAYPPNPRLGSARLLLKLGKEFRRLGHDVDHLWLDALPRWAQHPRIAWIVLPVVLLVKVLKSQKNGRGYDVVDVCGGDGWLVSLVKEHLRSRPVMICRSQGWEHEYLRVLVERLGSESGKWRRALLMRLLRLPMVAMWAKYSDAIIVGCSLRRALPIERGWKPEDRVYVVPYGIDTEYFVDHGSVESRKGVLYAGSWLHGKGVHDLTKAFLLIRESGCDIPLTILGFGLASQEVLQDFDPMVRDHIKISESQRFVEESVMMEEYRRHEVLVFPSHYEGFGLVFLEGMASGMAVVATPTGGVPDILRDHENGAIIPLGDPEALAAAVLDLWKSPERRRRLGNAARETARNYTWDQIAAMTLKCYGAAAGKAGVAGS